MHITKQDRAFALADREQSKRKMSAKAAERLRNLASERERDVLAEQRFRELFERLDKDAWTLRQLLERISRPANEANMTKEELIKEVR